MDRRIRFWSIFVLLLVFAAACSPAQVSESPTQAVEPSTTASAVTEGATAAAPAETDPVTESPEESIQPTPETSPEAASTEAVENAASDPIRFVVVPERSEARYRVQEQLAGVSLPNDAVGSTQAVTGTLSIQPDGTIIVEESRFVVDMTTLRSDESRRDNFLRRTTLQTDQFPFAVFVPTQVAGLPAVLPSSGEVSFTLTGDLTIRDVTRPVTWDVTGNLQSDELTAQAVTAFTFDDFSLAQPRVPVVLGVEDTIRLEFDVTLKRVSG